MNYYNDHDPACCAWLRELIAHGHLPLGDVDSRSIKEIKPDELARYTQCHFFAGIGGWSLALRLADWPDDKPVWTGSCPCQPYSAAGKQEGDADARNLWPDFFNLIRERCPVVVFGEQVASAIGHGWLDGISADLEGAGYTCGATVLGAHSVGAPHIRQRLYWVADSTGNGRQQWRTESGRGSIVSSGSAGRLADNESEGRAGVESELQTGIGIGSRAGSGCAVSGLALANGGHPGAEGLQRGGQQRQQPEDGGAGGVGDADNTGPQGREQRWDGAGQLLVGTASLDRAWSLYGILPCTDGKARRIESGSFPLAHGIPGRVGLLRGYGNAIVPQVAAEFIQAFDGVRFPVTAEADFL